MGVDEHLDFFEHLLDAPGSFGSEDIRLLLFSHLVVLFGCIDLLVAGVDPLHQPLKRCIESLEHLFDLPDPDAFPVSLCQLLHPPEQFTLEDGAPLVLEEESDELEEVHCHAALQSQSHVLWAHVEAACRHASLHKQTLLREVLPDKHVHSVKPPEGELDWPAVKPDHTHDVLIDVLDPISCFEDSDSL